MIDLELVVAVTLQIVLARVWYRIGQKTTYRRIRRAYADVDRSEVARKTLRHALDADRTTNLRWLRPPRHRSMADPPRGLHTPANAPSVLRGARARPEHELQPPEEGT